jgi:hypothetical protein
VDQGKGGARVVDIEVPPEEWSTGVGEELVRLDKVSDVVGVEEWG